MSENDPFLNELHDLHAPLDVPLVVSITDAQGVIVEANDAFCAISQFSLDLLVRLAARAGLDPKLKIAA